MKLDWMKYRKIYFLISVLTISVGIFSLSKWGLVIGVDFKGGSIIEYKLQNDISTEDLTSEIEKNEIDVNSIQGASEKVYIIKLGQVTNEQKDKIQTVIKEKTKGEVEELRFETVGPSVGPELIKKTGVALFISAGAILLWVAYQFKSLKFGLSAILAMIHDSLVLIGLFSLLGHFYGAEVDFLFVTALLTILSFSVHDTIVVYDRIREIRKKHGGEINEIANKAISETMRRSINNSLTIIFMLVALVVLGGTTVKWFAVALLIGTISGTYSSPFVAVPLLVTWDNLQKKFSAKKQN